MSSETAETRQFLKHFQDQTILVTGGAGFIGSHIVETLLKQTSVLKVRVIDNLSTGFLSNLQPLLDQYSNLEFMWGDITNLDTCRKACQDVNLICHQAALGSVPRSVDNPLVSHLTNVDGFLNLLTVARELDIKRIVYASSSSVYGTNQDSIKQESKLGQPMSPYAITKLIDELYARIFSQLYNMQCIGLRYFNVFGPRQNPNGAYAAVIPKFIETLLQKNIPVINGDGSYSRDFTYIENVVQANLLALSTQNSECYGQSFNVGTENPITIQQLFDQIVYELDLKNVKPIYSNQRVGDVPHSKASIQLIQEQMGYKPTIMFSKGLIQTLLYFMQIRNQKLDTI